MKSKNYVVFYLDRPDAANALDVPTAKALQKAVKDAVKSGNTGFIISSRNPRVFCAGGDLKAYSQMKSKSQGVQANSIIRGILQSLRNQPLLVVCAMEGDAIGGGCELALACDWIICASHSRFAFRQIGQNLTPGWGGAKRLLRRVGPAAALDWLTSGRFIGATEALRVGLADQLCATGQALTAGTEWLDLRHSDSELIGIQKKLVESQGTGEEKVFEKLWFSKAHRAALLKD